MRSFIAAAALATFFFASPALAQLQYMDYSGKSKQGAAEEPTYGFGNMETDKKGEKEEPYSGFGMQSSTVTPLEECLGQLPPGEAAEIRNGYAQPYRECRIRLANKAHESRRLTVTKQEDDAVPETPRNYTRVQKDPLDDVPQDKKSGKTGDGQEGFYGIKPDKSKVGYNH